MDATRGAGRRTAVAIVAKAPRAGAVKTRICPPLAPAEAAALHRAFLLDTIESVRRLPRATLALAYAPPEERAFFEALGGDALLIPQIGPDLGARLARVFEVLLVAGFDAVLALGADSPTLPAPFLRRAMELLADPRVDVVLGPSEDGGYYLVGLRAPRPELFEAIPWSTAGTFSATLARARGAGMTVACLPTWYDIDTPEDLRRLRSAIANAGRRVAPHTRRFLAALGGRTT